MKRRSFVKASLFTTMSAAILPQITKATEVIDKESTMFYELREYTLKDAQQQTLIENYFKDAAIPALKRLGIQSVGLFAELKPEGQSKLYALIPYKSLDEFMNVETRLFNDKAYLTAAEAYLNAPASSPAYERIESSLLKAFAHMPNLELPERKTRIFELRRYEHATESAGKKKL
ncbi:MAG: family containing protein, partial [Pedobacter sp.]|nr:family containing protein [Pedobacter sp.]